MAEQGEDDRNASERRTVREIIDDGVVGLSRLCERERQTCEDWLQFILTSAKPWPGRPLDDARADQILAALFARSTNTYWASIELSRIGFGEQAIMLNRSLFEDMVDAHWVSVEPDLARERFEQHFSHSQMLLADAARQHPEIFEAGVVPSLDETERPKLAKIFGDFGHKSWTGLDIHSRVERIEHLWTGENDQKILHFFRRIIYRDSNQQLHPSARALNELVRTSSDTELALKVAPGPEGVRRALWSAYWISVQVVSLVFQHFEFPGELQERMRTLVQQGQGSFHELSEDDLRKTGRNDPCPRFGAQVQALSRRLTAMRFNVREYRNVLWILREHEGWRAVRWPLGALGLLAAVWALPLAGGIGSYYVAKAGDSFAVITLSVVVTLALGGLGTAWSQRRPWWNLLANRARGYDEQTDPYAYARGIIRDPDYELAMHALRRAGLNARAAKVPGPPDAPELTCRLDIYRPRNCTRLGLESVDHQALRVLAAGGIDGRVGGRDVRTGLDIRAGSSTSA